MLGRNVGTSPIRGDSVTSTDNLNVNLDAINIAQVLKAHAGYQTYAVGKWGLGSANGAPWFQGFDAFYGQLEHKEAWAMFPAQLWSWDGKANPNTATVSQLLTSLTGNEAAMKNGAVITESVATALNSTCEHTCDLFRKQALAFLDKQTTKSAPFFLYWAPTTPHVGLYDLSSLLTSPVRRLGDRVGEMTQCRRGHAAQIEQHIDTDIAALLAMLKSKPWMDAQTLVIFASDNGAQQDCADDPAYTVAWFGATAGLRGYKRTVWEGGLRSPTMYRWPGMVPAGSVSTYPHSLFDLGVTLLDLAGLPASLLPSVGSLGAPGGAVSIANMLLGNASAVPDRPFLHLEWCDDNDGSECYTATLDTAETNQPSWGANSTLYKLVVTPSQTTFLFDLIADPFETNDLSGDPAMAQQLYKLLVGRQYSREPMCYGTPSCCYNSPGCSYLHVLDTASPTTAQPTNSPTKPTTRSPTLKPSSRPSAFPTLKPTTHSPTSKAPTSTAPSKLPTTYPTRKPTPPTDAPSAMPTSAAPTTAGQLPLSPTSSPTSKTARDPSPTLAPAKSKKKKHKATKSPGTRSPTAQPTMKTPKPVTTKPSLRPSALPTSASPSESSVPSLAPSKGPFPIVPTVSPTTYQEYINQHSR